MVPIRLKAMHEMGPGAGAHSGPKVREMPCTQGDGTELTLTLVTCLHIVYFDYTIGACVDDGSKCVHRRGWYRNDAPQVASVPYLG